MSLSSRLFATGRQTESYSVWSDVAVFIGMAALLYVGVHFAREASSVIHGPEISLSPRALPLYAGLSLSRMAAAYALSLVFTLIYGYLAAYSQRAERLLMPVLDVLQSVPILSFLPVVLLSLSAVLPQSMATELASVVLIFTSQVWNMTFAWYQSLITIPTELREASTIFKFNAILRFKALEFPFAAVSLIWNSMMSWAGGWFFLMAAEIFTVGQRDFRLPGLGAYLHEAAGQGDVKALLWGVGTLVALIVALDQLIWCPLLAWSQRFKLEMSEGDIPSRSWFYEILLNSRSLNWFRKRISRPVSESMDGLLFRLFPFRSGAGKTRAGSLLVTLLLASLCGLGLLYGGYRAVHLLLVVSVAQWAQVGLAVMATFLRVLTALTLALAWTVPVGVAIGTDRRWAAVLQPLVQIAASVPATALFPVILLLMLSLPGGLNLAAVLLMLLGTQWYLLFNIIAGAAVIPQDLKHTAVLLHMNRRQRWRTLILPALFPYIVTGGIAAGGGAWNASIVAEYVQFGGQTFHITGIGSTIAEATAAGDYALLLAATLSMILTVVIVNRVGWRRLYRLAAERYRME
jgi:NitT/TauT family transport system permease protein